jgi:hypothetical protein
MASTLQFNPLDWPVIFTLPERLTLVSAWKEHVPFAFFLIDAFRPKTFVELGTHNGDSYCAFCQAIQSTGSPTKAFAVDSWEGDVHVTYDSAILKELRAHHDPRYSQFSTLMKMTFDNALANFADGSVDLLHIDGVHTYEAVKHDFDTWLPKVRPDAGIVLFHDTAVHRPTFGVFKLMDELRPRFPLFEFNNGKGLGVLLVGDQHPRGIKDFFAAAQAKPEIVRSVFSSLGQRLSLKLECEAWRGGYYRPLRRAGRVLDRFTRRWRG